MDKFQFGKYLRTLRENKGMTVNQLAVYSNVSPSLISLVENGKRGIPKPETLSKIADALNMPAVKLISSAGYFEGMSDGMKVLFHDTGELDRMISMVKQVLKNSIKTYPNNYSPVLKNVNTLLEQRNQEQFREEFELIDFFFENAKESQRQVFVSKLLTEYHEKSEPELLQEAIFDILKDSDANNTPKPNNRAQVYNQSQSASKKVSYDNHKMILAPLLNSMRGETPIEMIRELEPEYEFVHRDLVGSNDVFILKVKGDSMSGDCIFDGDRVVVVTTADCSPSDVCAVSVGGDEVTLQRVKLQGEICMLTPSNPGVEPMIYPAPTVKVIGVVVEVRRRLKK